MKSPIGGAKKASEVDMKHPPTGVKLPSDFRVLEGNPLRVRFSYEAIVEVNVPGI